MVQTPGPRSGLDPRALHPLLVESYNRLNRQDAKQHSKTAYSSIKWF